MPRLEKRFYTLDEIAQAVGRERNKHFARDCKNDLLNWKYQFQWEKGKGVNITGLPETSIDRLTALVRGDAGKDVQVNVYAFACFLAEISNYESMPWNTRTPLFNQKYNLNVSESSLKNWMGALVKSGNVERFKKGSLWKTVRDSHGNKTQVSVEPDSPEYKEYSAKRSMLLAEYEKSGMNPKNQWPTMLHTLSPEYGTYYYSPAFVLNALGENAEEISQLVAAVMAERREEEK